MPDITQNDIDYLSQHPDQAANFDKAFGAGTSARYLTPTQPGDPTAVEPSVQPTARPEGNSGGLGHAIANVAKGAYDGAVTAVEQTLHAAGNLPPILPNINFENGGITTDWKSPNERFRDDAAKRGLPNPTVNALDGVKTKTNEEAKTAPLTYSVPRGISQFLTGFAAFGELGLAAKAGTVTKGLVNGALTDAFAFDPHDPRFANMLQEWLPSSLQNPVVDFLAAKPGDSEAEGRLKNVLEGAGLGVVAEAVFAGVRGMRGRMLAKTPEEAKAATEDAVREIEKHVDVKDLSDQLELFPDAATFSARQGSAAVSADGMSAAQAVKPAFQPVDEAALTSAMQEVVGDSHAALQGAFEMDDKVLSSFNWSKINGPVDIAQVMHVTAKAIKPQLDTVLGKTPETFDMLNSKMLDEVSDMFGIGSQQLLTRVKTVAATAPEQAKFIVTGKTVAASLAKHAADLAFKVNAGHATDIERAQLAHTARALSDLEGAVKVIQTSTARAVSAGRITVKPMLTKSDLEQLNILADYGGDAGIRELAAKLAVSAGNPKAALAAVRPSALRRGMDAFNENWINAILSGPKTHLVNMASNLTMTALMPLTRATGAAIMGDARTAREALRTLGSIHMALSDSYQMSKMALKLGDNVLDVSSKVDDRAYRNAISAEGFGIAPEGHAGQFVTAIGKALNLPSRLLLSEDEFFKQLNYRSDFYGRLWTEASDKGLTGTAARRYVDGEFARRAVNPDGSAKTTADTFGNTVLTPEAARSVNAARTGTFTQELPPGSFGRWVQGGVNRCPPLRLLLPFVRTPTNIIKTAVAYTPGANMMLREYREALRSADPAIKAQAVGQMALGSALTGTAVMGVLSGNVTGGGPKDPKLRAMWIEAGWRPYSIRAGGTWIDYQRLDPWATAIGLIADAVEIHGQIEGDAGWADNAAVVALALGKTALDKTYLEGLATFLDAANNPERPDKLKAWVQRMTASAVPYSSFLGQTAFEIDPVMRETRGVLDLIKSRVPGWSDSLPPKVSWLTGEAQQRPDTFLSPISAMDVKDNPVALELIRLGETYQPSKMVNGVELTGAEYSALCRTMGTLKDGGGRTLQASLTRLFDSPQYDMSRNRTPDPASGVDGFRSNAVNRIVDAYHQTAIKQMARADPAFHAKMIAARQAKALSKSSNPSAVTRADALMKSLQ